MIKMIVLDVDGTLTNGQITYTNTGEELKSFNVKDGLAISTWTKKMGKKASIITGRKSLIVEQRAKDLGIYYVYQGVDNKAEVLQEILQKEGMSWSEVAVIGDDLNDYNMLKNAGLSFAPKDASNYIIELVDVICSSNGGNGAVRDMIEYIVREYEIEDEFLNKWV